MSVDPSDDCTFWYTNEYIASNGSFNWHTRIGSFKFAGCSTAPSDFSIAASPGNLNVASGQQVHVANAQVGGNVKVAPGGLVSIVDSRVGGNVSANGALEVTMCKTTVGGSVSLIGTTGDVLVGDGGKCPTNTIGGGLEIDNTPTPLTNSEATFARVVGEWYVNPNLSRTMEFSYKVGADCGDVHKAG